MDARSMSLIRDSLAKLIPIAGQADALFNVRLLDTYPDLYRLFATDIDGINVTSCACWPSRSIGCSETVRSCRPRVMW